MFFINERKKKKDEEKGMGVLTFERESGKQKNERKVITHEFCYWLFYIAYRNDVQAHPDIHAVQWDFRRDITLF